MATVATGFGPRVADMARAELVNCQPDMGNTHQTLTGDSRRVMTAKSAKTTKKGKEVAKNGRKPHQLGVAKIGQKLLCSNVYPSFFNILTRHACTL